MSFSLTSEKQPLRSSLLWCVFSSCWRSLSEKLISFSKSQKIQDGWTIWSFSLIASWFRFEVLGVFLVEGDLEMLVGVQCLFFKLCEPMCLDKAAVLWKCWNFCPPGLEKETSVQAPKFSSDIKKRFSWSGRQTPLKAVIFALKKLCIFNRMSLNSCHLSRKTNSFFWEFEDYFT